MTFRIPTAAEYERNEERARAYHEQLFTDAGATCREYLESRGLSESTWRRFRFGAVVDPLTEDRPAQGKLSIPVALDAGVACVRFRRLGDGEGPKYWSPAGSGTYIYNVTELMQPRQRIVVCEGELDTATLWQCGVPAVGFPGASSWRPAHRHLFEGFNEVLIMVDHDDSGAGQQFADMVAAHVPGPLQVLMPEGSDVNSYYTSAGREALLDYIGWEAE